MSVTAAASFTAYLINPSTTLTSVAPNPSNNVTTCVDDTPEAIYGFNDTGCGTSDAPFNSVTYAALAACCDVHLLPYDVPVTQSQSNGSEAGDNGEVTTGAYCPIGASALSLSRAFTEYVGCVQNNSPCTKVICGALVESNMSNTSSIAPRTSARSSSVSNWKFILAFILLYTISTSGAIT